MDEKKELPPQPPSMPVTPPAMPPAPPSTLAVADPYATTPDDRTSGMLVHLLALLTGIIGVLVIWLVKKDQSRFVDHHGKEALNFQLTMILSCLGLVVVGMVTVVGMIIAFPLICVIGIVAFVFEIMACIAANRGEWHRYPLTIRFIS